MRSSILVIALLQLVACATPPAATAPGCHGARRPANPFGSVLTDPKAAATPQAPADLPPVPCAGGPR